MSKTYFETERLIIREADERDIEDLYELYTDANVLKYNCIPPLTRENIRDGIESGEYSFCIKLKGEGKVIGAVGFCNNGNMRHDVPSRCISYELNTKYTKKGYMTEAVVAFLRYCFEELGVDVVSARVFDKNENSLRMLKRLGFTEEGRLRHAVRSADGIIYDDCLFSILKSEFENIYN